MAEDYTELRKESKAKQEQIEIIRIQNEELINSNNNSNNNSNANNSNNQIYKENVFLKKEISILNDQFELFKNQHADDK